MSQRYLLTCSCGTEHAVETAQAGDTIRCDCGESLQVPSFRDLQKLPPVRDPEAGIKKPRRSWHPLQGLLFGLGAVLFLIPAVWGTTIEIHRRSLDMEVDPSIQRELERNLKNIGNLKVHESYEVWKLLLKRGLGRRNPPAYVLNREVSRYWLTVELQMAVVSLLGLALIVTSLWIQPGRNRQRSS